MTILHHPSEFTLVDYANGRLDMGRHLVVETHVEHCQHCSDYLGLLDKAGGALLDAVKPVALGNDALQRTWAKIERALSRDGEESRPSHALDRVKLGKWRWIGPRVQWRSVDLKETGETRVFMLRAAGGTWLPRHKHTGTEWTCVLEGAFSHAGGRYGPGDFDEADDAMEHHPFVEEGVPCVCLIALQGKVQFESWIGRLIQPFVRL